MTTVKLPIRLAFRQEGRYWNSYLAKEDTMDNAVHIGSIAMAAVAENEELREGFKKLMIDVLNDFIKDATGYTATMTEQAAPEHEKSGNA